MWRSVPARWPASEQLFLALGERDAVIVGHDWGAMIAWTTALLRPDRVRGVAALSIPFIPRGQQSLLTAMRTRFGDNDYMQYFQQPGIADAELARDTTATFRSVLHSGSGQAPEPWNPVIPGDAQARRTDDRGVGDRPRARSPRSVSTASSG
ncbi:alpha/beta hydrolase [Saccharopolyspora taberi]|uniref:AB hydrolase-1 domain-containing protein n=1 Tax=Saccharopolyspora taberi TaxID=60895 RepID=A0ABN3VE07_9PSEU